MGSERSDKSVFTSPEDWQPSKNNLKERFSHIFNNEDLSDIHFIVGQTEPTRRIPAHKLMLSTGSPVFYAMFNHAWPESQSADVKVPDVEPDAFLAFLRFLYTDEVQVTVESSSAILYIARKYIVPSLENQVLQFLCRQLCPDNAFTILSQVSQFTNEELLSDCLETIDENAVEALSAPGFCEVNLDVLCLVLKRDSLRIPEVDLFQAVCRWAKAECKRKKLKVNPENQSSVLGKALWLIRFPVMSSEEFGTVVADSGILTPEKMLSVFLYFSKNPRSANIFSDTPRGLKGPYVAVRRFQSYGKKWTNQGDDRICFTSNQNVTLHGFGVYGSVEGLAEHPVNIIFTDCNSCTILSQVNCVAKYTNSIAPKILNVFCTTPVQIIAQRRYSVCLKMMNIKAYCGKKGTEKVCICLPNRNEVTFTFSNASNYSTSTNVSCGQIPEILITINE